MPPPRFSHTLPCSARVADGTPQQRHDGVPAWRQRHRTRTRRHRVDDPSITTARGSSAGCAVQRYAGHLAQRSAACPRSRHTWRPHLALHERRIQAEERGREDMPRSVVMVDVSRRATTQTPPGRFGHPPKEPHPAVRKVEQVAAFEANAPVLTRGSRAPGRVEPQVAGHVASSRDEVGPARAEVGHVALAYDAAESEGRVDVEVRTCGLVPRAGTRSVPSPSPRPTAGCGPGSTRHRYVVRPGVGHTVADTRASAASQPTRSSSGTTRHVDPSARPAFSGSPALPWRDTHVQPATEHPRGKGDVQADRLHGVGVLLVCEQSQFVSLGEVLDTFGTAEGSGWAAPTAVRFAPGDTSTPRADPARRGSWTRRARPRRSPA